MAGMSQSEASLDRGIAKDELEKRHWPVKTMKVPLKLQKEEEEDVRRCMVVERTVRSRSVTMVLVGRGMPFKLRVLWSKRSLSGVTNMVYVRFKGEL